MKESVRIFRFIVIGTMNALIMALVVWLMMREMSFEGDYMVANVTAYIIAQIHNFIWCKYWMLLQFSSLVQVSILRNHVSAMKAFWFSY